MPKISIVILTYNSINFIKPCLDSIFNQDSPDYEVIVVDNGSQDGTADFIKKNYPQVKLIENRKNFGACKARNQGIELSGGDWILTLDSDTILKKDFLLQMLTKIQTLSFDNIGMIQPKILKIDKKTIYSVGIFLSSLRRFFDIGKDKKDSGQFDKQNYIFGGCSAAVFYKRQMLEEIKEDTGYFDERLFFLVEDVDLAWRAKRRGWSCIFSSDIVCFHYGNSSNYDRQARRYLCFRNRLLMILKNERLLGKIKLVPVFFIYDLSRLLFLTFSSIKLKLRKDEI